MASGNAEGSTPLNAFDNALLAAGAHNLNLIRVSSIVPKGCEFVGNPDLPVGTLAPTVYSSVTSSMPGETISACIGAGIGDEGGVLMEYHHTGRATDCERVVMGMIDEGFRVRGWTLIETRFSTGEHTVEHVGAAVAVALMLDPVVIGGDQN